MVNMYNCREPPAFKVKDAEDYQPNQKLMHNYPNVNNQFNSHIRSLDTAVYIDL